MRAIVIAVVVAAGCGAPQRAATCKLVEKTTPRGEERYCEDGRGARSGAYERRFPGGAVAERGGYANGALDGDFVAFYANGVKRTEGRFVRGERDGAWRVWHENGKLWTEGAYTRGHPTGRWVEWDYTGTQAFEGTYVYAGLDGKWRASYPDGSVRATGTSDRGALEGVVELRQRDGTRMLVPYRANKIHGMLRQFDKDGLEKDRIQYVDGVAQPGSDADAP